MAWTLVKRHGHQWWGSRRADCASSGALSRQVVRSLSPPCEHFKCPGLSWSAMLWRQPHPRLSRGPVPTPGLLGSGAGGRGGGICWPGSREPGMAWMAGRVREGLSGSLSVWPGLPGLRVALGTLWAGSVGPVLCAGLTRGCSCGTGHRHGPAQRHGKMANEPSHPPLPRVPASVVTSVNSWDTPQAPNSAPASWGLPSPPQGCPALCCPRHGWLFTCTLIAVK